MPGGFDMSLISLPSGRHNTESVQDHVRRKMPWAFSQHRRIFFLRLIFLPSILAKVKSTNEQLQAGIVLVG